MEKKLIQRGKNVGLPINGDLVVEVQLNLYRPPVLIFQTDNAAREESQLEISDRTSLARGDYEQVLTAAKAGLSFDLKSLSLLVNLLGSYVVDALALHDGALRIEFSNDYVLSVTNESMYLAWEFCYPRQGRPPGGKGEYVNLRGDHGRLTT